MKKIIIQLGSTRDGLESYKELLEAHEMECILIETPEYLALRNDLGRQPFKQSIAVNNPTNPDEIIKALQEAQISPFGIIAGFDRYNYAAYDIAKKLSILPYDAIHSFRPLTKIEARNTLKALQSPIIAQPKYLFLPDLKISPDQIAHMQYPLVIKPIDSSYSLGTFLVKSYESLTRAIEALRHMKHYGGDDFTSFMIEEFIPGHEYSVQGFVRDGTITILSYGKKFIFTEKAEKNNNDMYIFRESGLMVTSGDLADNAIKEFTKTCIKAFNYRNGAFHIDMKYTNQKYYFLEAGFRISGELISSMSSQVSGYNWIEETITSLFKLPISLPRKEVQNYCIGQVRARLPSEIKKAQKLTKNNKNITMQLISSPTISISSERLKSDINRLMGTVGRITVKGKSIEEVENIFLECLVERTPQRVQ